MLVLEIRLKRIRKSEFLIKEKKSAILKLTHFKPFIDGLDHFPIFVETEKVSFKIFQGTNKQVWSI